MRRRQAGWRVAAVVAAAAVLTVGCRQPEPIKPVLQRAVKGYASVPSTPEEFRAMWRTDAGAGQVSRAIGSASRADDVGLIAVRPRGGTAAADVFLRDYVATTPDQVVILVGHNDQGIFAFPDGSSVDLAAMRTDARGVLAVVSCSSVRYADGRYAGVPVDLAYDYAYKIQTRFRERIRALDAGTTVTVETAQLELNLAMADVADARTRQIAIAVGGAGLATTSGAGITIYVS
jgi:lysophospholipase L1-like esterase